MILFACPLMFLLLPLPFLVRRFLPPVKGLHGDALRVPFLRDIADISIRSGGMWRAAAAGGEKTSPAFWWLCLVWLFLTAAAARPQWLGEPVRIRDYGRDIMLVMDISTSMREPDFVLNRRRIDRLTAVKLAADDFIKRRKNDRIGLVLFGTRAYLQSPVTFDRQSVREILRSMDAGMAGNSTSIGDALGLGAGISWGFATIFLRTTTMNGAPASQMLFWQLATGAVVLTAIALLTGQNHFESTTLGWTSLLFQTFNVSFASYLVWNWLLRRYLASRLGVFLFMTPIFGVVLSVLLLDETVGLPFVGGSLLVLVGLLLAQVSRKRRHG